MPVYTCGTIQPKEEPSHQGTSSRGVALTQDSSNTRLFACGRIGKDVCTGVRAESIPTGPTPTPKRGRGWDEASHGSHRSGNSG